MKRIVYRINEIFYSLQGEGHNTGRAAIFIRFAGCNLRCPFCDTDFRDYQEMEASGILAAIADYPSRFVVLTGGEPTLQVDEGFVNLLHTRGYEVAMESNGILPAPHNLDWLTVSPKKSLPMPPEGKAPDEIKIVFENEASLNQLIADYPISFSRPVDSKRPSAEREGDKWSPFFYLQPCDTGDPERNKQILHDCIKYVEAHPQWRLSIQIHKLIDIK